MLGLPLWGSLRDFVRRASSLGKDDLEASNKLKTYLALLLLDFLKEQLLFNVGLSPLNPVGIFSFSSHSLLPLSLILFLSCADLFSLQTWMQMQLRY